MTKRLTLEDIAKMAGVSRATVSRVINNHPNIRDSVRQHVQDIIEEAGYHPNIAARTLVTRRSGILGLVIPRDIETFFSDPYFARLMKGIAQACNKFDYILSLFVLTTEEDEEQLFRRISQGSLVDGIIVQATHLGDGLLPHLVKGNVPFLVAGRPMKVDKVNYIDVDNVTGAYNAVSHLVDCGCRRIATITGPLESAAGYDRLQGYQNALQDNGLTAEPILTANGDFSEKSGYQAAVQLLKARPDAIFAASDTMAVGAMKAIQDARLHIPENIKIIGFDDLPPARSISPKLSTVRQPIRRFGYCAVELLVDILEKGPAPERQVVLDTELVVRETCCAEPTAS